MPKNNLLIISIVAIIAIISTVSILVLQKPNQSANKTNQSNNSTNNSAQSPKEIITTSFYPVQFLTQSIAGNEFDVQSITPSNISPHDYETTLQDQKKINDSKLFLYMGAGIDKWADKISQNPQNKSISYVAINKSIDLQKESEEGHKDRDDHKDEKKPENNIAGDISSGFDPHTWLDPKNMIIASDIITKELIKLSPSKSNVFTANNNITKQKLTDLDSKFAKGFIQCRVGFVVTSHDAFGYLSKSYNFDIEAVAGTEPSDQISLQAFQAIVSKVADQKVKYVFAGDDENSKTIESLATKTNTKVLELGTIETVGQGEDYFTIMNKNLQNLVTARECN
jgi:zinc transport system substrate-binding protein